VAYRTFFTGKACLTLLVFIGLSGCSIPTIFDHQITWNTPYLNQTECPDLDGTYQLHLMFRIVHCSLHK